MYRNIHPSPLHSHCLSPCPESTEKNTKRLSLHQSTLTNKWAAEQRQNTRSISGIVAQSLASIVLLLVRQGDASSHRWLVMRAGASLGVAISKPQRVRQENIYQFSNYWKKSGGWRIRTRILFHQKQTYIFVGVK